MKRITSVIIAAMMCLLIGCGVTPPTNKNMVLPEGYSEVELELPTGVKVDGIGVEFDPHFFSQNVTRNVEGLTEDKWQIVVDRVTRMQIDKFRVMILPSWLEPQNDNSDSSEINWASMTKDSLEMQSLKKVLDLAESIDADVTLVLWGVPVYAKLAAENYVSRRYFMAENHTTTNNWVVAPKGEDMEEEFCENFSAYIQYLVSEKGYGCITEVTPINEPNWSYQIDAKVDLNGYVSLCQKLDARFEKDGIRDLVKFNLVDSDREHNVVIDRVANELFDIADMTNAHTYSFGYDTSNSTIVDWTKRDSDLSRSFSQGHYIGEFGSNQTVGSTKAKDIASFERGVLLVRLMLNFFNGGANGMSYWSLADQYYNAKASYSEMMQTGLWYSVKSEYAGDADVYKNVSEDFAVKKQYYAYSLMTSNIPRNADIYPIKTATGLVAGTKFASEAGDVYVYANNGVNNYKLAFAAEKDSKWQVFVYAEGNLPTGDALIPASRQITVGDDLCVSFEVNTNTAVLIKQVI